MRCRIISTRETDSLRALSDKTEGTMKVFAGLVVLSFLNPVSGQTSNLHDSQYLRPGLYSAVVGPDKLVFFTGNDFPAQTGPAQVELKKGILLFSSDGNYVCTTDFIERASYDAAPAALIVWTPNHAGSVVYLDDFDRVSSRGVFLGKNAVTVSDASRFGNKIRFYVNEIDGSNGDQSLPQLSDVSASLQGPDFEQVVLKLGSGTNQSFEAQIPANFLAQYHMHIIIRVARGTSTVLFPNVYVSQ
jgi:hypothetical protein